MNEYISKVLENSAIFINFRKIDLQNLVDQVINDLLYAKMSMHLDDCLTLIFINIFYAIYAYMNPKFKPKIVNQQGEVEKYSN